MSAGGISHARDKDCVSRSNVCGGVVLFADGFIVFREYLYFRCNFYQSKCCEVGQVRDVCRAFGCMCIKNVPKEPFVNDTLSSFSCAT